jgi:methylmalonyl-CoA/ethylmalonyl-CoA epimerase
MMDLDHICIAVKNIDKTAQHLQKFIGYCAQTSKVINSRQKVVVQFFRKQGSLDLKLIEPSEPSSPLMAFIKKGEGLHHLGFKVEQVEAALTELKQLGAIINTQAEPGEAFDDELIGFSYLGRGLNIEIIDTDKRRNRL